jgi:hypothetical protein
MTIFLAMLAATAFVGLAYVMRLYRLHSRHWRPFLSAFSPAKAVNEGVRKLGEPCALVLNGTMLGDGTRETDRRSLARPRVQILTNGLAFFMSPDPLALFTPVLVQFTFVKSFGRVRDDAGEWIEVEFQCGGLHGWAHLPTTLASILRTNGIAEGIPAYRLHILEPLEEWSPQSAASIYRRSFNCSWWVADKLKEVEHRDPLDVVVDLEALTHALDEGAVARPESYAKCLLQDPATSYWLRRLLDECCRPGSVVTRNEVDQLLVFARARLQSVLAADAMTHSS